VYEIDSSWIPNSDYINAKAVAHYLAWRVATNTIYAKSLWIFATVSDNPVTLSTLLPMTYKTHVVTDGVSKLGYIRDALPNLTWLQFETAWTNNVAAYFASGLGGDTTVPTDPTSLSITAFTDTSISLSWTASTDNVGILYYFVYLDTFESPLCTGGTGTTYTINNVKHGTYNIRVRAVDTSYNVSGFSNTVQQVIKGMAADFGAYTLSGQTSIRNRLLNATTNASYTLSGQDATFSIV